MPGSTTWIHQHPLYGSTRIQHLVQAIAITWIHHVDTPVSIRIHQCYPQVSITGIKQDPPVESTWIHLWDYQDPTGPNMWINQESPHGSSRIHQDISCRSTMIQHMYPPGSTAGIHQNPPRGSTRIHHLDSPESIKWIQQDPSHGCTRIHQEDPPGSMICIHQETPLGKRRKQEISSYCYFLILFIFFFNQAISRRTRAPKNRSHFPIIILDHVMIRPCLKWQIEIQMWRSEVSLDMRLHGLKF